jgi:hypothetical protein
MSKANVTVLRKSQPEAPAARAPAKQRLRAELAGAHLALDEIDSFLHVCGFALRGQACDVDNDVAVVLDAAWSKVKEARDSIVTATEVLDAVAP